MCNYKTLFQRNTRPCVSVLKTVFLLLELQDKPYKKGKWLDICMWQHSCIIFQDTVYGPIILSEVLDQVRLTSFLLWTFLHALALKCQDYPLRENLSVNLLKIFQKISEKWMLCIHFHLFQTYGKAFLFLTVSLQDINMKKAFKSSTVQDQQVVSKNSIPNPVADIYNQSDKPPPLNILSPYR